MKPYGKVGYTYNGIPTAGSVGAVRLKVGDTDLSYPKLTDEEYSYLLTSEGSVLKAAIAGCLVIAAKFSTSVDKSFNGASESCSQIAVAYRELAKDLQKQLRTGSGLKVNGIYCGGISVADKDLKESDTDRPDPDFERGMNDYEDETSSSEGSV